MKVFCFIFSALFLFNMAFSQAVWEISFKYNDKPEVFMDGLSDTLIWSGNVIISFSDLENLLVEEIELVCYMVRKKDKSEVICGDMLPKGGEPCKEDFKLLFGDIEKKIRQFDFFINGDKSSICSERISFLIHFIISPK